MFKLTQPLAAHAKRMFSGFSGSTFRASKASTFRASKGERVGGLLIRIVGFMKDDYTDYTSLKMGFAHSN